MNRLCAGKSTCALLVNTQLFGDPCGYNEFLTVSYICVPGKIFRFKLWQFIIIPKDNSYVISVKNILYLNSIYRKFKWTCNCVICYDFSGRLDLISRHCGHDVFLLYETKLFSLENHLYLH